MKRSLRWRLTVILGGAVLFMGLAAAVISFLSAYSEAKEFQDHLLMQLTLLIEHNTNLSQPTQTASVAGFPEENKSDPEERIRIFYIPKNHPLVLFEKPLKLGMQTIESPKGPLRIYACLSPNSDVIAASQPVEMRDELALETSLHSLAPMLLFLPLMAGLIMWIVRRELQSINNLSNYLDAQPADQPRLLSDQELPSEIIPFVQAINRLLGRVNNLMAQQRRFIADAAHELRSPLTALSLQIQNLEKVESLTTLNERIRPLRAGIERAKKLTEQLLNLARVQLGEKGCEEIDVSSLLRRLLEEYLPLAQAKDIDLGLDEIANIKLTGSSENIHAIVRNGLENALKYTPSGGMVTIRIYCQENQAYLEVVDNGPGIDESLRWRLFDPFFRAPNVEMEGNGLGLAIAQEAANSQGGHLELIPRSDQHGLIFRYSQHPP